MLNKFHITTTMLAQAVWFLDRLAFTRLPNMGNGGVNSSLSLLNLGFRFVDSVFTLRYMVNALFNLRILRVTLDIPSPL